MKFLTCLDKRKWNKIGVIDYPRLPGSRFFRQWIRIENFRDFRQQRPKRTRCSVKRKRAAPNCVQSSFADWIRISIVQSKRGSPRIFQRGYRILILSNTKSRQQRDKEEAASKEHSTPPTRESWPIWIRSSLHTIDSQMPDPIRLYSDLDNYFGP